MIILITFRAAANVMINSYLHRTGNYIILHLISAFQVIYSEDRPGNCAIKSQLDLVRWIQKSRTLEVMITNVHVRLPTIEFR
jgi:hypothetical protein